MKTFSKKISAALLSVIMICSFVFVSGCGLFDVSVTGIAFVSQGETISQTELTLGDRLDLSSMVSVRPALASNKSFTVRSDNAAVLEVESVTSGGVRRMYAQSVSVGTATLTATTEEGGKTAELEVTVTYAEPSGITAQAAGESTAVRGTVIINSRDIGKEIAFESVLGANTDPQTEVSWSVSGSDTVVKKTAGETFAFTPQAVGRYEITASVNAAQNKSFSDTVAVHVTDTVTGAILECVGSTEQEAERYTAVRFGIKHDPLPEGNPEPITEWLVNGEAAAYGYTFVYTPSSPGLHEIEARINGESAGKREVRVSGTVVPQNVYVDFDNCYPEIWIRWDTVPAKVDYKISVTDIATGREVSNDITSRNSAIADKFTNSGFNASDFITDIFSSRYAVKVKTLGDGNLFAESDWSNSFTTPELSERTRDYLNSKFYDGARNRYIASRDEFYEWFEYAMLWRTPQVENGEKLYLAYDYVSASAEIEWAMGAQHFTGSYLYGASEDRRNRRECTFTIEFQTDGYPSLRTTGHSGEAWNAMRPHVNYDSSKARPAKYEFPIDKLTPVSVSTSDQLYYTAQLGYRPVPVSGSAAERLYNYARRTLRYIITDEMDDVEKLHAIYDWIMWRNIYDYEVLSYTSLSAAVKYEAYYLESIFTDINHYGVCDAMSKAFALMCSIEGFECMRVTGTAGTGRDSGGHAWNKVKLYGKWYIVDCTWGDVSVQLFTGGDARESASHMYFLVTDADVKSTHFEDDFIDFPKTATTRYPWYDKDEEFGGKTVNGYFGSEISATEFGSRVADYAEYMVSAARSAEKTYKVGFDEANRTAPMYIAFEIVSSVKWGSGERSVLKTALENGLKKQGLSYSRHYYIVTSTMGTLVHAMVFLSNAV